jgi:hypothetical protein
MAPSHSHGALLAFRDNIFSNPEGLIATSTNTKPARACART